MSRNARCLAAALLGLMLLACAAPAAAEYATYQGQIQLQPIANRACAAVASEGTYDIVIVARDDGPARLDGYLLSDKLVHVHILGNNINELAVFFPGDTVPDKWLRLQQAGSEEFTGELPVQTLVAIAANCKPAAAQIRFKMVSGQPRAQFEQAEQLFQLDSQAAQAVALINNKGALQQALPIMTQALAAARAAYGPNDPQLVRYQFLAGQAHELEGSFPEALPLFRDALANCEKYWGADSACSGVMLAYLSAILMHVGDLPGAESTARHALEICDKLLGPTALSGQARNVLGAVLLRTGRYVEAEAVLNTAMTTNAAGGDYLDLGVSMVNLGTLYRVMGQYPKAEDLLRRAVALNVKTQGPDGAVTIINTAALAQIVRVSGRPAEAEALARQALAAGRKRLGSERQDNFQLQPALMAEAEALRDLGRYPQAEPLYREAIADATKYLGPNCVDVAAVEVPLSKLLRITGRAAEANRLLLHAHRVYEVSNDQWTAWRASSELMLLYSTGKLAQPAVAIFYGKEAVNDLQRMRSRLAKAGGETQAAFVSANEVSSAYRSLADLLVSQGRLPEAQQVLAMLKEQELYDFTEHVTDKARSTTVATLNSSEKQLAAVYSKDVSVGQEYAALSAKYAKQHNLSAADQARFDALDKQLEKEQKAFDAQAELIASAAKDPQLHKRLLHEIDDNSRAFLGTLKKMGHGAVVLQYYIMNDNVKILLTTPEVAVARESTIKRADLNARILKFRKTLANPAQDPAPQAKALYKLLIAPIAGDLHQAGAKTLMLSLDDTLRYVPFAALHDGKSYLVENYSVVMMTEAVRDKIADAPLSTWKVWGLGVTQGGEGYDALPNVGIELNSITGRRGILGGQVLLDKSFTESALKAGIAQRYPIIHIASHFQFTPGSMQDSFLLLGDGSHMTLADIKTKLNFNGVEMLTLSACETAIGDDSASHHGVEVEGLGAIAQQSGAKSVLATLWPVADGSTALLMSTLYKEHKDAHLDKADALRQAQLALLKGSAKPDPNAKSVRGLARIAMAPGAPVFKTDPARPFAHPYYWAPFILMGNWL